jgi:hypothetical protein
MVTRLTNRVRASPAFLPSGARVTTVPPRRGASTKEDERMRHVLASVMILAGGLVVWGCGNKGEDAPTKPAAASAAAATSAAPTAAAPSSAAPAAEPIPATKLPEGRSAPPTLEEWSTLKKEVTVKGSSALKCETKIIREYLRVSCKGKVTPEGTPTGIKLLRGGREAMVFAHKGVTSLILPYVEGTDFEAAFSWTAKSHKLAVKWPKGSKQPVIVGAFEGAASPLDGTARGDAEKLCACHMKVTKEPTCENLYGAPDADCDRTFADNCGKLLACARGEIAPTCLPGFFTMGAKAPCFKKCSTGNDCAKGQICASTGFGSLNYCVED